MDLKKAKEKFAHAGHENAILACIFKDPTLFYDVDSKLSEKDFLKSYHKAIFTIIQSLVRQGVFNLDTASLMSQAVTLKLEDSIGGYDYVNALFEKSIDPANINFYIQKVLDSSVKVQVVEALEYLGDLTEKNRDLTGETLTADTIVETAQQKFLQIAVDSNKGSDAESLSEGIDDLIEEFSESATTVRGLSTGFKLLDEAINGLEPGTLTVLGARPKVGKSGWMMNVAKHIAYNQGVPVLYIDTEMHKREQQTRLVSILSQVPERDIKNGLFAEDPSDRHAVEEAVKIMKEGLILHKYYPDFNAEGVAALARKHFYQHGIRCVIFDYIKLPDADLQMMKSVAEHQALGYLCVALKNLAGQLQIPVLTAAQIGRTGANKGHVNASEFADSDRILRYANTLLAMSIKTRDERDKLQEMYGRDVALKMGSHRLQILDTRAGGTNYTGIDINFRQDRITMTEAEEQMFLLQRESEEVTPFEEEKPPPSRIFGE